MKKKIWFAPLILVTVVMVFIGSDVTSAMSLSSQQPSASCSAQAEDLEARSIGLLLLDLSAARSILVDQPTVSKDIEALIELAKVLEAAIKEGNEKTAKELKYLIANDLETLVTGLPEYLNSDKLCSAFRHVWHLIGLEESVGAVTEGIVAEIRELYKDKNVNDAIKKRLEDIGGLVNLLRKMEKRGEGSTEAANKLAEAIWLKIFNLKKECAKSNVPADVYRRLDLLSYKSFARTHTYPTEVTPSLPETTEPISEIYKMPSYTVKVLYGATIGGDGQERGTYSTAINIYNPTTEPVTLWICAVEASRLDGTQGEKSPFRKITLQPGEAVMLEGDDFSNLLASPPPGQDVPLDEQLKNILMSAGMKFIEGFMVIRSRTPLNVVVAYTSTTPNGASIQVKDVPVGKPQFEECPTGCECLTDEEASKNKQLRDEKAGKWVTFYYDVCADRDIQCGVDEQGIGKYCFKQKILPQAEETIPPAQLPGTPSTYSPPPVKYYLGPGPNVTLPREMCSPECSCLTEVQAKSYIAGKSAQTGNWLMVYFDFCLGKQTQCGVNEQGNPKYCYERKTKEVPGAN